MPITTYSGYASTAYGLDVVREVALSGGGGANGVIDSVTAKMYFSTNDVAKTYTVKVDIVHSGGVVSSTRNDIKFDSGNYGGTTRNFTFTTTGYDVNSITAVRVLCTSASPNKIYIKGSQYVQVEYTPTTKIQAPTYVNVAPSLTESKAMLTWSGAVGGQNNPILDYEWQYDYKPDGGEWTGVWSETYSFGTNADVYTKSVSPPALRGESRKYRIRATGWALGYESDWVESNTVRRNKLPIKTAWLNASPTIFEAETVNISWAQASDPDGNYSHQEIELKIGAANWAILRDGVFYSTSTTGNGAGITVRGTTVQYRARSVDLLGVKSDWTYSNTIQKNMVPGTPQISFPTADKTTYNSRPYILIRLGSEPDGQVQTLISDGYTPSTSGSYAPYKYLVLRKNTSAVIGDNEVKISTRDSLGARSDTRTQTYQYQKLAWTDPTLTAGATRIKAAHINELRNAVSTIRAYYGLAAANWGSAVVSGQTSLNQWHHHIGQLRGAIYDVVALVNSWDETATTNKIPFSGWIKIDQTTFDGQPRLDVMNQLRALITML